MNVIKRFFGILSWLTLALLMYGAADVVGKAQSLNRLTPVPVLGYVLVCLVAVLVWWLLVKPVFDFWRLSTKSQRSLPEQARSLIRRFRRRLKKSHVDGKELAAEELSAYARLDEIVSRKRWDLVEAQIKACVPYDGVHAEARAIILSYSRAAALAVAFSRNSILDGLCMIVVQMELVVALARLYGYRPSPVFNLCCFCWIAANSFVTTLLNSTIATVAESAGNIVGDAVKEAVDATTPDAFGDALGELAIGSADEGFLLGAEVVGQKIASFTVDLLLEAIMSGATVYVTGRIFASKLEGEWVKPTLRSYVKLRCEGRVELGKGIPEMMKNLLPRVFSVSKGTIISAYTALHEVISK